MKELKVQPIRNGTVIDHIEAGMAFKVLRILGLPRSGTTSTLMAAMNVPSKELGRKDIVKIEDRELVESELNKIALVAPRATINIIRQYEVAKKQTVSLPKEVTGLVQCSNPNCITNQNEPVAPSFLVESREPPRLRCKYCDRDLVEIGEHIL